MQMESEYGSESSEDELAHVDRGGGEAWRNHKSWAQISQLLDDCLLRTDDKIIINYVSPFQTQPYRSAYLQFKKLEYFSIMQQETLPLDLLESDEILCIEAIVKQWMQRNRIRKLAHLHEASRIGQDDKGWYADTPMQELKAEERQRQDAVYQQQQLYDA